MYEVLKKYRDFIFNKYTKIKLHIIQGSLLQNTLLRIKCNNPSVLTIFRNSFGTALKLRLWDLLPYSLLLLLHLEIVVLWVQILVLGKEKNHKGPEIRWIARVIPQVFFYQLKIHVSTVLNGLGYCRGEETKFLFVIFWAFFTNFFSSVKISL